MSTAKLIWKISMILVSCYLLVMGIYYGTFAHDYAKGAFFVVVATMNKIGGDE